MKHDFSFNWFEDDMKRAFHYHTSDRQEATNLLRMLKDTHADAGMTYSFSLFAYGAKGDGLGYFYYYNGSEWMIFKM